MGGGGKSTAINGFASLNGNSAASIWNSSRVQTPLYMGVQTLPENTAGQIKDFCKKGAKKVAKIEKEAQKHLPKAKKLIDDTISLYNKINSGEIASKTDDNGIRHASYKDSSNRTINVEIKEAQSFMPGLFPSQKTYEMNEYLEGQAKPIRSANINIGAEGKEVSIGSLHNFEADNTNEPNYFSSGKLLHSPKSSTINISRKLENEQNPRFSYEMRSENGVDYSLWMAFADINFGNLKFSGISINQDETVSFDSHDETYNNAQTITIKRDGTPVKAEYFKNCESTGFFKYNPQNGEFEKTTEKS